MVILPKDILSVRMGVVVHSVSLQGVLEDELSEKIRERWPIAYKNYLAAFNERRLRLGMVQFTPVDGYVLWVASLVSQQSNGTGRPHTDYSAIRKGVQAIQAFRDSYKLPVFFPYNFACDTGGGDWNTVATTIRMALPDAVICRKD